MPIRLAPRYKRLHKSPFRASTALNVRGVRSLVHKQQQKPVKAIVQLTPNARCSANSAHCWELVKYTKREEWEK